MHNNNVSKLISICIPSYNRGHRALDLVIRLQGMDCIRQNSNIEIIVSDNGSTEHTAEYDEIRSMTDDTLVYNRFETNRNFYGNFNTVVKMSRGQWCMLLSDEDTVDESEFENVLELLESKSECGVIKAKTSKQYANYTMPEGCHGSAGYDALRSFFLMGNYISGTIYNRKYVTNELIDGLCGLYEGNEGYFHYPHLFVEGFVLNLSDFYYYDRCFIIEGEPEKNQPLSQTIDTLPAWSSWESRVAQLEGYLRLIRDLQPDRKTTDMMFRVAVWRTVNLIALVKEAYVLKGMDWPQVCESSGNRILEVVSRCGIAAVNEAMLDYLQICAQMIKTEML
ncbi:MAG: glycosyltransferase [Lachnospiraceae bacterium]|nr:glycosyltransferase [Lachnospiraceae bacterium]